MHSNEDSTAKNQINKSFKKGWNSALVGICCLPSHIVNPLRTAPPLCVSRGDTFWEAMNTDLRKEGTVQGFLHIASRAFLPHH